MPITDPSASLSAYDFHHSSAQPHMQASRLGRPNYGALAPAAAMAPYQLPVGYGNGPMVADYAPHHHYNGPMQNSKRFNGGFDVFEVLQQNGHPGHPLGEHPLSKASSLEPAARQPENGNSFFDALELVSNGKNHAFGGGDISNNGVDGVAALGGYSSNGSALLRSTSGPQQFPQHLHSNTVLPTNDQYYRQWSNGGASDHARGNDDGEWMVLLDIALTEHFLRSLCTEQGAAKRGLLLLVRRVRQARQHLSGGICPKWLRW